MASRPEFAPTEPSELERTLYCRSGGGFTMNPLLSSSNFGPRPRSTFWMGQIDGHYGTLSIANDIFHHWTRRREGGHVVLESPACFNYTM